MPNYITPMQQLYKLTKKRGWGKRNWETHIVSTVDKSFCFRSYNDFVSAEISLLKVYGFYLFIIIPFVLFIHQQKHVFDLINFIISGLEDYLTTHFEVLLHHLV